MKASILLITAILSTQALSQISQSCMAYEEIRGNDYCDACYKSLVNTEEAGCLEMPTSYNCEVSFLESDLIPTCILCNKGFANDPIQKDISKECVATFTIPNCRYASYVHSSQSPQCVICENGKRPSARGKACIEPEEPFENCIWYFGYSTVPSCWKCAPGFTADYQLGYCVSDRWGGCTLSNQGTCMLCDGWNGFYMDQSGNCKKKDGGKVVFSRAYVGLFKSILKKL